jgi:DNA topoisomerase VI subunit B
VSNQILPATSAGGKRGRHNNHTIRRVAFRTSREMDFFSEKELITQIGHPTNEWPLVIVKELADNCLDICDEEDISPRIDIAADDYGISVRDNGPGLPEDTLKGIMDFTVRVSSREAYVAPDRGRQGNALKTLVPMPSVLDPRHGRMVITAHGKRHVIACGVDPISQRPVVRDDPEDLPKSKNSHPETDDKASFFGGTEVRLEWDARDEGGNACWPFGGQCWPRQDARLAARFRRLVEGFALFNPHATIRLDWFGEVVTWEALCPQWEKWKPKQPTSAHWYELVHLKRLIGACITQDRDASTDRLISELVEQFDGYSGSAKRTKVLGDTGLKRAKLSELVAGDTFDDDRITALLAAMRRYSKPVTWKRLGEIGEDNLKKRLLGLGVLPESFRYERKKPDTSGPPVLPYVLECAFGYLGNNAAQERRIYTGANWSAAITNPFRSFGATGEGLETVLANLWATRGEPIVFAIHLAHPRVEYTDRGKSALVVEGGAA